MTPRARSPERRGHHRLSTNIEVRYGSGGEFRRARGCDVSPAGIGLAVPVPYQVGAEVDLRFQAHSRGDLVLLKTRVRHSTEGRMGLEFVNVSREQYPQILGWLHELEAERAAATA
jgi:c-di-GMP-binding flagellar brake protein YcgR